MAKTRREKLSILLVTPQLSFGGAEVHVANLANGLIKDGHRVTILSSGGDLESNLDKEIHVSYGPVNNKSFTAILKCAWIIRRIIIEKKIDLIHTHAVTPSISARLAAFPRIVPIVNTAHGWEDVQYARVAKVLKWTVNQVIAISESMEDHLIKEGLPAGLVEVVYNGTDLGDIDEAIFKNRIVAKKEMGLATDSLIVTTVARLEPPKGLFVLMDAIEQVVRTYPKIKFLLVGDGTIRPQLEKRAHELGLDNYVLFLGWQRDVKGILAASDIFCLPSLREGLPLSVAEAMGASLPVVATAINGLPEMVIDKVTGFLVPANDPEAIVEKILALSSNPSKRQRMGMLGRRVAEDLFSHIKMIKNTEKIYSKLMK